MSAESRAAQFAPFAALTGYDDAVKEMGRPTSGFRELSEDELEELNCKLARLSDMHCGDAEVDITYFVPDAVKQGGEYQTVRVRVRRVDSARGVLVLSDKSTISMDMISDIAFTSENNAEFDNYY